MVGRRWELTGNGFQEQIEGVGPRRVEILAISLVPWTSKHPLAFSKVELVSVSIGGGGGRRGVQDPPPTCSVCGASYPSPFLSTHTNTVKKFSRNLAPLGLHSGVTAVIFQLRKETDMRAPPRNHKAKFWLDM